LNKNNIFVPKAEMNMHRIYVAIANVVKTEKKIFLRAMKKDLGDICSWNVKIFSWMTDCRNFIWANMSTHQKNYFKTPPPQISSLFDDMKNYSVLALNRNGLTKGLMLTVKCTCKNWNEQFVKIFFIFWGMILEI